MVVLSLKTDSEIYISGLAHILEAGSHLCCLPSTALTLILLLKGVHAEKTGETFHSTHKVAFPSICYSDFLK